MAQVSTDVMSRALHAIHILRRHCDVARAYLFGSHVWGTPDEWSDIDVAAFVKDLESWDLRREVRTTVDVQREVGDRVELHLFPASVLPNPEPASFSELILRKGVLIEDVSES